MNDIQGSLDSPLTLGVFHLAHFEAKRDVLGNRHVRKKRIGLKYNAKTSLIGFEAGDVPAGEQDLSGGWRFETGNHVQGCRLAAPRRAEEADELAFVYRQIHRRYGVYIAKRLGDVDQFKVGHA